MDFNVKDLVFSDKGDPMMLNLSRSTHLTKGPPNYAICYKT